MQNPYGGELWHTPAPEQPQVIVWYRVYCAAMILLYVVVAVAGGFLLAASGGLEGDEAVEAVINGVVCLIVGPPLAVLFLVGALVPARKWGWIYGWIPIRIGLTSCCCLPASIPLLIFWIKPETKAYFGA